MNRTIIDNRKLIKEHIEEVERSSSKNNNLFLIRETIKKFGGKICNFHDSHYGYVIGATCCTDDYYWCFLDQHGKIGFSTCCGNPKLIDYIPSEYNELLKVLKSNPNIIKETIKNSMAKYEDIFFTDVYIGDKIYNRNEFL